ncbi:MAG: hypothetical protein V7L22_03360 [Nostoc sp.]|nr:hypothetical protein [Nostoc sp. C052]
MRDLPGSGTPEELLHAAKIDASSIVEAVRSLLRQPALVSTKGVA